jgi:hypothetical protein
MYAAAVELQRAEWQVFFAHCCQRATDAGGDAPAR